MDTYRTPAPVAEKQAPSPFVLSDIATDETLLSSSASNGHIKSTPSLASILQEQLPLLIDAPDVLTPYFNSIEQAYATLVPDPAICSSVYPLCAQALTEYTRQCSGASPRARARLRKQCLTALEKLAQALNREHKLGIVKGGVSWLTAFGTIDTTLVQLSEQLTVEMPAPEIESQDEPGKQETKGKISASTRKLLAAIVGMPEQRKKERFELLQHHYLWTDETIQKFVGTDRAYELWQVHYEMHQVVNVWEPSEQVDGLLKMEDRRYLGAVARGEQSQEMIVSRKDATALVPSWPNQLHVVAQPEERQWKRLGHFFDVVATTLELPTLNHYSSAGLLRLSDGELQFVTPLGGAITPTGRNESGMVMFPVQYQDRLANQPYQLFEGDEQDTIAGFRLLMKARNITPKTPEAPVTLFGVLGLAPLSQIILPNHVLIHGRSQSKKSTLVRLFLQMCTNLYGHESEWCTFNLRETLPTDYYIEQMAFYLAGLPLLFDDGLKGKATGRQVEQFYGLWSKFLSYALTKQGRGRGKPGRYGDGGVAKNWYPRSPMIATVEGLPRPQDQASTLARCALVMLDGFDCLDMALLDELQTEESARAMNQAYTRYIRWSLQHVQHAEELVARRRGVWKQENLTVSSRLQSIYAWLEAGTMLFTEYGHEIGAIDAGTRDEYQEQDNLNLVLMAQKQTDLLELSDGTARQLDPLEQFKRCLEKALTSQKLCLAANTREVVGANRIFQMPKGLPEDFDELKVGWKHNTHENKFERGAARIAGILHRRGERGGSFSWMMKIKAAEWEKVYAQLEKVAGEEDFFIPGARAMLGILADAGIAKKDVRTTMWDGAREGKCHLFNMEWYIEGEPETPEPGLPNTELETGVID